MNEERLRELLRDAPVPDEAAAEERGLRVVQAAFEEHRPPRASSRRRSLLVAVAAAVLGLALLLTPAGAEVGDWIGDRLQIDDDQAAPALTRLPSGGHLLVDSRDGVWVVSPDGSKRRLGEYDEGSWSPNGRFVAVAGGHQLTAVDPIGNARWSLSRPRQVSLPRWSPSGYRVSYLSGDELRVVAGDGTDDRILDSEVAPVAAAWQPDLNPLLNEGDHVLAFADRDRVVRVVNADLGTELARASAADVTALDWSGDASELLVAGPRIVQVFDPGGGRLPKAEKRREPATARLLASSRSPAGARTTAAAFAPAGNSFALTRVLPPGAGGLEHSELVLVRRNAGELSERRLLLVSGAITDLAWSPDGDWLLVAWRDADQWLFVPLSGGRKLAVGNIGREFDPGGLGSTAFPSIAGWCCRP